MKNSHNDEKRLNVLKEHWEKLPKTSELEPSKLLWFKGTIETINYYTRQKYLNKIPFGIVDKESTGAGGTFGILNAESDDIIVLPLKSIIKSKLLEKDQFNKAALIGVSSDHANWKETISTKIAEARKNSKFIKILAITESLHSLFYILYKAGVKAYDFNYTIDEFHLISTESSYRNLSVSIDYYQRFPVGQRRMITATPCEIIKDIFQFSDTYTSVKKLNLEPVKVNFIKTREVFQFLRRHKDEYDLIFYNYVGGIEKVAEDEDGLLISNKKENKLNFGKNRIGIIVKDMPNFITTSNSTGYDFKIGRKARVLIVLDSRKIARNATFIDYKTFYQVIGRDREIPSRVDVLYHPVKFSISNRERLKKSLYIIAEGQLQKAESYVVEDDNGIEAKDIAAIYKYIELLKDNNFRYITLDTSNYKNLKIKIDEIAIKSELEKNEQLRQLNTDEGLINYYVKNNAPKLILGDMSEVSFAPSISVRHAERKGDSEQISILEECKKDLDQKLAEHGVNDESESTINSVLRKIYKQASTSDPSGIFTKYMLIAKVFGVEKVFNEVRLIKDLKRLSRKAKKAELIRAEKDRILKEFELGQAYTISEVKLKLEKIIGKSTASDLKVLFETEEKKRRKGNGTERYISIVSIL